MKAWSLWCFSGVVHETWDKHVRKGACLCYQSLVAEWRESRAQDKERGYNYRSSLRVGLFANEKASFPVGRCPAVPISCGLAKAGEKVVGVAGRDQGMRNLTKACILALDEALLVALVFVVLWQVGVRLSPWVIATTVVALGAWIVVLHKIIKNIIRRKQAGGREGMIGRRGKVVKLLAPDGVIRTRGELWKASCTDGSVGIGEEVTVLRVEGLRLVVERRTDTGKNEEVKQIAPD